MKLLLFAVLVILFSGCTNELLKYHGKNYRVIKVGDSWWMAENLATSRYKNGKPIPLINDTKVWTETYSPACGFYNSDSAMLEKYGMLYNWYAVSTGKLCPRGWRVSSHEDWNALEDIYGGWLYAGGKIKSADGWKGKHVSGDNTGFRALPGGYRLNEDFIEGWAAIWWTSTDVDMNWVWGRRLGSDNNELMNTFNNRQNGFSVRCVKNRKSKGN
jgi:uncharacterized protein (TIGR02145 family)